MYFRDTTLARNTLGSVGRKKGVNKKSGASEVAPSSATSRPSNYTHKIKAFRIIGKINY